MLTGFCRPQNRLQRQALQRDRDSAGVAQSNDIVKGRVAAVAGWMSFHFSSSMIVAVVYWLTVAGTLSPKLLKHEQLVW